MKVLWVRFKILSLGLFLLAGIFSSSACYEKRARHSGGDPSGPRKPGGGAGNGGEKIYGLAVVDFIFASPQSLTAQECGNMPSSLREVRQIETELRIRGLSQVIDQMADMSLIRQLQIPPEDCSHFSSLEKLSREASLPTYPEPILRKPALHLRIVIWPGDHSFYSPSSDVLRERWAVVQTLESRGVPRSLSLNYFAITETYWGYILRWLYAIREDLRFIAPVPALPAPTPEAVDSINQSVRKSTEEFRLWLFERSTQP